ncbi:hypothetical protein D3C71_1601190 [compost metagenome]
MGEWMRHSTVPRDQHIGCVSPRLTIDRQLQGGRLGDDIEDTVVELQQGEEVHLQLRLKGQMPAWEPRWHDAGNRAVARRDFTKRFHGLILSHNFGDS